MAATLLPYRLTTANSSDQRALVILQNTLTRLALNRAMNGLGALSGGTTAALIRSNGTITFCVDGVYYTKASTDDLWTPAGTASAVSQTTYFLLYLNAAGTASLAQVGPYSAAQGFTAEQLCTANLPALPDAKSIVGAARVVTDSATTYTPGTTSLAAAGVTTTYYDGCHPSYNRLLADQGGTAVEGIIGPTTNS